MKIKSLHIEGYRSLKNVTWEPGDLNILVGPNGSGKSNIFKLMKLVANSINQSPEIAIRTDGGLNTVLWDSKADKVKIKFNISNSHLRYFSYEYPVPDIVKLPPIEQNEFEEYFRTYKYYQSLDTSFNSRIRFPVVTGYEQELMEDTSNFIQVLHTLYTESRIFRDDLNRALIGAFGKEFEELVFAPAADQMVQLRIRWKSLDRVQSALEMSDGTLRFLYLLLIFLQPDLPPIIALDEPELGLHPSMLPIIAEIAAEASQKSQIILATQSPELLDAFTDFAPTTTVFFLGKWRN